MFQWKSPKPAAILLRQLLAGPAKALCGILIELVQGIGGRAVLVKVAFDAWNPEPTDQVQTLFGLGAVANDVTQANRVGATLDLGVFKNLFQGL